jgi:hypothetical protein
MKFAGFSGSRTCEQSRRGGISEEQTTSFVREMKQFRSSKNDETVQPLIRLEEEPELKDVKIDARLTITSNDSNMNTWYGFVSEGALFLRGNGWDEMEIREVSFLNCSLLFLFVCISGSFICHLSSCTGSCTEY